MVRAIVVSLLALLLAGCGLLSPANSSTSSPIPSTATPEPAGTALSITAEQMVEAPLPSLCDHPAGTLVDGALDGPGENDGGAWIAGYPDGDWRTLSFHSWKGTDSRQYAALVVDCNQGGVGWPPNVVFYTDGPTVVGQINVADVVGDGRQSVAAMEPLPNGVRLTLPNTYQDGDAGCCGTQTVVAEFYWDGYRVRGEVIQRIDERSTAKRAFTAALVGDRAAIDKLFTAEGKPEALEFHDSVFLPDPADWSEDFSCGAASDDELFDASDREYDRVCYFGAEDAYVAAFVAMRLEESGDWRAVGIQFTSTD